MAMPIIMGFVGTHSGLKMEITYAIELAEAYAKLAKLVNRDMQFVQPTMNERGRDMDFGARAAVHQ